MEIEKWLSPGYSKLKMVRRYGVAISRIINPDAAIIITSKAMFFSNNTEMKFRVFESVVRIKNMFPIINEEKAMALISPLVCCSPIAIK